MGNCWLLAETLWWFSRTRSSKRIICPKVLYYVRCLPLYTILHPVVTSKVNSMVFCWTWQRSQPPFYERMFSLLQCLAIFFSLPLKYPDNHHWKIQMELQELPCSTFIWAWLATIRAIWLPWRSAFSGIGFSWANHSLALQPCDACGSH